MKKLLSLVFSLSIVLAVCSPAMADVLDDILGKRFQFYTNTPGESHHSNGCQQIASEFNANGSLTVTTASQIWDVPGFVILAESICVASHFDPAKVYVCQAHVGSNPPFFDFDGGTATQVLPLGKSLHGDHIAQENHNAPTVPISQAALVDAVATSLTSGIEAQVVLWENPDCVDPRPDCPWPCPSP